MPQPAISHRSAWHRRYSAELLPGQHRLRHGDYQLAAVLAAAERISDWLARWPGRQPHWQPPLDRAVDGRPRAERGGDRPDAELARHRAQPLLLGRLLRRQSSCQVALHGHADPQRRAHGAVLLAQPREHVFSRGRQRPGRRLAHRHERRAVDRGRGRAAARRDAAGLSRVHTRRRALAAFERHAATAAEATASRRPDAARDPGHRAVPALAARVAPGLPALRLRHFRRLDLPLLQSDLSRPLRHQRQRHRRRHWPGLAVHGIAAAAESGLGGAGWGGLARCPR